MRLTREQRAEILSSEPPKSVRFDQEPDCKVGDRIVVKWTSASSFVADRATGEVVKVPPEPVFTIVVTRRARHRKGWWQVHFDIEDRRYRRRLVRRKPPPRPPDRTAGREVLPPGPGEIEQARQESGYTTSLNEAVDHLDAIEDTDLERFAEEARVHDEIRDLKQRPGKHIQRELLRRRNKMLKLQAEARRNGVDITPELDQAIKAVTAKLARHQAAA